MKPTFSVIVPTIGRATLGYALTSIATQLGVGDEILVLCNRDGDSGNRARNKMIERAQASHLVFLDDDDEWLPGALEAMRSFAAEHPDRVGLFRVRYQLYGDVWNEKSLREFHTPMAVVPNILGKVGRFGPADLTDPAVRPLRPGETPEYLADRWGDYEFIRSTLMLRGDEPIWLRTCVAVIRPERNRWRRLRYEVAARTRLRRAVARFRPR